MQRGHWGLKLFFSSSWQIMELNCKWQATAVATAASASVSAFCCKSYSRCWCNCCSRTCHASWHLAAARKNCPSLADTWHFAGSLFQFSPICLRGLGSSKCSRLSSGNISINQKKKGWRKTNRKRFKWKPEMPRPRLLVTPKKILSRPPTTQPPPFWCLILSTLVFLLLLLLLLHRIRPCPHFPAPIVAAGKKKVFKNTYIFHTAMFSVAVRQ